MAGQKELAGRHFLRSDFVRQQAIVVEVETIAMQKLPANGHFGRIMNVRTNALLLLGALAKLVEEHAVLLGSGLS